MFVAFKKIGLIFAFLQSFGKVPVASVHEIINKQNEKINDLERHSRKNNLRIIGVPYTKDEDCVKVSKTRLNSVLNTDVHRYRT